MRVLCHVELEMALSGGLSTAGEIGTALCQALHDVYDQRWQRLGVYGCSWDQGWELLAEERGRQLLQFINLSKTSMPSAKLWPCDPGKARRRLSQPVAEDRHPLGCDR